MNYQEIERGVYETRNYKDFKFMPIGKNRKIDEGNRRDKIKSISEYGLLTPIEVSRNMEIIDGQHRFLACQELGVPVKFRFSDSVSIEQLAEMNRATKKWTGREYIHTKSMTGDPSYRYLDALITEFEDVDINTIMQALRKNTGANQSKYLRNVSIIVPEYENARRILKEAIDVYDSIKDGEGVSKHHLKALVSLLNANVVDAKWLKENLCKNKKYSVLKRYARITDIVQDFEDVCNRGLHYKRFFCSAYKEAMVKAKVGALHDK